MSSPVSFLAVVHCLRTLSLVAVDLVRLVTLAARPRAALVAENLFLRKQLALFQERKVRPRRADAATRWMMAALSPWFAWRDALVNVQADTLLRWHRQGFRLFWRWKSKTAGRPRLPNNLQALIREMAAGNPTWGQERIADELQLKLGMGVSPRTVAKYLHRGGPVRAPDPKQRWLTFVHNHAKVIVACDFFVVITATFRTLYVFVLMEVGTRRILHHNVTAHPTAEWTLQQFRETLPGDHPYRFVLHDRDSIFSQELDKAGSPYRASDQPRQAPRWRHGRDRSTAGPDSHRDGPASRSPLQPRPEYRATGLSRSCRLPRLRCGCACRGRFAGRPHRSEWRVHVLG